MLELSECQNTNWYKFNDFNDDLTFNEFVTLEFSIVSCLQYASNPILLTPLKFCAILHEMALNVSRIILDVF